MLLSKVSRQFIEHNVLYFAFAFSMMYHVFSRVSSIHLPRALRLAETMTQMDLPPRRKRRYTLREPIKLFDWLTVFLWAEDVPPELLLFCRWARVQYLSPSGSKVLEIWEVSGRAKSVTGDPVESEDWIAAAFSRQRYLEIPVRGADPARFLLGKELSETSRDVCLPASHFFLFHIYLGWAVHWLLSDVHSLQSLSEKLLVAFWRGAEFQPTRALNTYKHLQWGAVLTILLKGLVINTFFCYVVGPYSFII